MKTRLPVIFIVITVMLDSVGIGLIMPVMPGLINDINGMNLSEAVIPGTMLAFTFAFMQFLFGPTVGNLSDHFGRRPILLTSLVAMSASYLVFGLAGSLWMLFIGRIATGITGATFSTANAYMADITPPEKRAASFGLTGAAFGVGFVIGPALGGLLGELGVRAPFFAAAGVAMANAVLGYFVLPETLTPDKRRKFELSRCNPLRAIMRLRHVPEVGPFVLVFFLFSIAHNVYPSVWPFFTQEKFAFSEGMVGISLAIFGVFLVIVQGGVIRAMVPRFGEWKTAMAGLAINVVVLSATGLITSQWMLFALMPIMALGVIVGPSLQGLMSKVTDPEHQGELQGVLSSVQGIAMIISPLVMGQLFHAFTKNDAPAYLPGAPFIMAALLALGALIMLSRKKPKH